MGDNRFLAELEKRVLLGSGAMGTEFLRRGCLPGRPLDELNLTRPNLVLDLSREYVAAGAEVIKTNTFLANRFRLHAAGLGTKVREINLAGAKLARDAAKGAFVAGCVGPLAELGSDFLVYREQCRALAEGGCDLLLFETFTNFADLNVALRAGWTTGLPIVCQIAQLNLIPGLLKLTGVDTDAIGVNCVTLIQAAAFVAHPGLKAEIFRSAFPSGGVPGKEISPEEFARGIEAMVKSGARLVGGCCGAGPDHIRAAAQAIGRGR